MPFDESPQQWVEHFDRQDVLAKSIRLGLSVCGPIGAIFGEFLTEFVPGQRVDRLHDFAEHLAERLSALEDQFRERLQSSPTFASLTEQASVAAVQTASGERRRDLAELLRTGLSRSDVELVEHHALLRLLGELNDPQILILMNYGNFRRTLSNPEREQFRKKHSEVFDVRPPTVNEPPDSENARRWTMYRHYEDGLVSLGLLRENDGTIRSSTKPTRQITPLSRLLLHAIGRSQPTSDGHV
jgi:hypothetical protein